MLRVTIKADGASWDAHNRTEGEGMRRFIDDPGSVGCANDQVAGLIRFVAARVAEDRAFVGDDPPLKDVCDLAETLIDVASKHRGPDGRFDLSAHQINALVAVASLHREHPDFDDAWL